MSTVAGALWQEFDTIHGGSRSSADFDGPDASLRAYYSAAARQDQAALCLSGGGIRSAAFSLGVIQDLARRGLLREFHYLSTVSGGGYIGGWLTALLRNRDGDLARVEQELGAAAAPAELKALRHFTNFLSPRPGLSSPDTWAAILLWVRNALVNWMVFLPALFGMALLPVLYRDLLLTIGAGCGWLGLAIGLICLFIGIYNGARHMPSHALPSTLQPQRRAPFVPTWVVAPLLAWSVLAPLAAAPWMRLLMPSGAVPGDILPPLMFIAMVLAYLVAALTQAPEHRRMFWRNLGWWTLASLVASVMLWIGLSLAIGMPMIIIAIVGPLVVTVAHLLQSLVYVALRSEAFRGELDREWLARLNAEKVVPALLWAVFAAVCLWLPRLILDDLAGVRSFVVSAFGLLTGPVAALIGKFSGDMSGKQGAGQSFLSKWANVLLAVVAGIFAATLFMLLGRLAERLAGGSAGTAVVLVVIVTVLSWALGRHVNVNRFSLHAVYRNRIVRAFLGTARSRRRPDDFTGIDPADNPRMTDMAPQGPAPRRLFHVINLTLNLTADTDTAWAERKGESFTITPCASGAANLHRQEDAAAGLPARGAYVTTARYAGAERETGPQDSHRGITLGTAIALSGAAASPSMGYHSSSAAAFLMTLFNVRLGAWLPNPAIATTSQLQQAKPPNALLTLARELMGKADDRGDSVYLSDGGHFENLGIYEMVRRRCRRILVVDAGADGAASFEDLGNAVRKVRIDFDVDIQFDPAVVPIGSRDAPLTPFRCFAYGLVHYPEGGPPGELIYVKPADLPAVAMDVRSYRNLNLAFPHQSTLDEFFGESQFESYRQLGLDEMSQLAPMGGDLKYFFDNARRLAPPSREVPRKRRWPTT
ncbi:patatin-like phospholipase family protein [Rhodopila sp.]|uniref:patatin-like phospholipase family protein n=1 Tax=Rhodopila sp. TaxID=2480087 RepID=UPI002C25C8F1|nr:patatin-like phospholipase family protein [Rhodopila sp.]HVZ10393.1 patatin-like phospholipase family protein [Rhodopila sp.]